METSYLDPNTKKGMCEICEVRKGKRRTINGIAEGYYCDICHKEMVGGY